MFLVDILREFAASAFQPGVNRGLVVVLHAAFILLLAVLMFLNLLMSFTNIHIWALICLSTGLYTSIIWFINEVYGEPSQKSLREHTHQGKKKIKKHA